MEEEIRKYIGQGEFKYGNAFVKYLRKSSGLPVFEYSETYFALSGTEQRYLNKNGLTDLGDLGWEIMYVSPTKDPGVVSLLCKRLKQ